VKERVKLIVFSDPLLVSLLIYGDQLGLPYETGIRADVFAQGYWAERYVSLQDSKIFLRFRNGFGIYGLNCR
jgi:hypothetical protein